MIFIMITLCFPIIGKAQKIIKRNAFYLENSRPTLKNYIHIELKNFDNSHDFQVSIESLNKDLDKRSIITNCSSCRKKGKFVDNGALEDVEYLYTIKDKTSGKKASLIAKWTLGMSYQIQKNNRFYIVKTSSHDDQLLVSSNDPKFDFKISTELDLIRITHEPSITGEWSLDDRIEIGKKIELQPTLLGKGIHSLVFYNESFTDTIWIKIFSPKTMNSFPIEKLRTDFTLKSIENNLSRGCIEGDCYDGNGAYEYEDKTIYFGEFKKGLANGYGVCYYSSGQKYSGEWKNHNFHGKGTFNDGRGKIITGIWEDGRLLSIEEPKERKKPKVYSIVIGISSYSHMRSLRYTDDDAYKMYSFMKDITAGGLESEQITLIIDEDGTRRNILEKVKATFQQAGKDDMVMLYYSGHGLEDGIVPYDYSVLEDKILYETLYEIIDSSKAKHKICIIDACHSGGMLAMRNSIESIPTTAQIYYDGLNERKGGTAIITSSRSKEFSVESSGLYQGVFTHFWIKGLKGMADTNNDKIVTISEVFNYVQKNVTIYTSNYQTPQLDGNFDPQLPLSIVK